MPEADGGDPADVEALLALMPFSVASGVRIDSASASEVTGHLDWSPERCTADGVLHGGAIMTLADSLGGLCAYLNLPAEATTATVSSATTFIRAVRAGRARGCARPLHVGRSIIVVQTDIADDQGRLAAQVTQTQAVVTPSVTRKSEP